MTPDEMTPLRMAQIQDGRRIWEMVIPIGLDEAAERREMFGGTWDQELEGRPEMQGHFYKCRYWDDRTRECIQYDTRPSMCSEYPYGNTCKQCGATA